MKKRILSCLMALALCLTLLPATALAAEEDTHTHCLCGAEHKSDITTHKENEKTTFDKWLTSGYGSGSVLTLYYNDADKISGYPVSKDGDNWLLDGGNYYLRTDVENYSELSVVQINHTIVITGNVTICLNGQTLESIGENMPVFRVKAGGTLTLTDCQGNPGKVKHTGDGSGSGVEVESGGTFNMYGGKITGNTAVKGGGVYVSGGTFNMYGGEIAYNKSEGENSSGGGVYVVNGTFTMSGGTISGNEATNGADGGVGVYNNATFTMSGGKITGNKARSYSGGVGVHNLGTFTMNGGTIGGTSASDANTANYGGGVNVGNNGQFEMTGGEISGNKATENGGGVYVNSGNIYTFTMNGEKTSVSGNTANYGGGVYVNSGTFKMNDGTIGGATAAAANTATHNGGGVYVKGGKFEMNGPKTSVSGNTATDNGGGVYVEGGTFTMHDGTIGGTTEDDANKADQGGGVYASGGTFTMSGGRITGNHNNGVFVHNTANTTFTVSGAPTVTGNTRNSADSNVFLAGSQTITIGGTLNEGASIGVTKTAYSLIADNVSEDYSRIFSSDDETREVKYEGGKYEGGKYEGGKLVLAKKSGGTTAGHKHCICGETHTDVGDHTSVSQIEFATKLWYDEDNKKLMMGDKEWTPTTTTVGSNNPSLHYVLSEGSYYLGSNIKLTESIHIQKGVKLCLNGFSIISNGTETGRHVIIVEGSSLTLTDCKGSGKITHADRKNGGGVSVYDPSSVFNMFGGIITGNNIDGGVKNNGTFNMYGGEISDNEAGNGGGVYVNQVGKFNMYGGSITGNRSVRGKGSGVYVNGGIEIPGGSDSASTKIVKITGNTEDNLYLAEGKVIKLGSVHYQTSVGVTTAVKPEKGNHVKIADVTSGDVGLPKNITSDAPQYVTERVGATLVLKTKETEILVSGITLNGEKWNLKVGDTQEITATVAPNDATKKDVIWTSSNTDVATVENGVVTAKAAGTATITVKATDSSNVSATCEVTVTADTTTGGGSSGGSTGGNTGGSSSSGGSSSGGSGSYDSNPIIKTETKNNTDGSTTKTETRKDGSVTQTTTGKDGSVSKTETKKDGSSVTENKAADGSTGTVKTDKHGQTEAKTALSNKAIEDAKKNGEAVKAPVEVKASHDSSTAPTVKVELPKGAGETKVEIPVSNVKPGTVAVLVHPDGTEEILKASVPTENGIRLTVDGSATVKIVDNSKDFIDTRNHWAREEIDFVSARELVNGMSDTIYAPNASATRAQLWTILARQNDADLSGGANWYEKAQLWSKDKGISDGTEPNAAINRAQMVTMLWRTMGQPAATDKVSFADVPAGSYYAQAVAWAVESGITQGVGGGRFDPAATCTRAQIAAFLTRLYAEK